MNNKTMNTLNEIETALLARIYNLVLDQHIREWERHLLLETKNRIEISGRFQAEVSRLEAELRPLAIRQNLTPKLADFYKEITSSTLFGRGVGVFGAIDP